MGIFLGAGERGEQSRAPGKAGSCPEVGDQSRPAGIWLPHKHESGAELLKPSSIQVLTVNSGKREAEHRKVTGLARGHFTEQESKRLEGFNHSEDDKAKLRPISF